MSARYARTVAKHTTLLVIAVLLVSIATLLVSAGCLVRRHMWRYRVEADTDATVNLGDWDMVVKVTDYNYDKGKEPKAVYHVSVSLRTSFRGEVPDTESLESVPLIAVDSICVHLPSAGMSVCPEIGITESATRLTWYSGKWNGPIFGVGADIPNLDTIITVSFVAILSDRLSGSELQRQEYSLDLKRFYKPYRILMQ